MSGHPLLSASLQQCEIITSDTLHKQHMKRISASIYFLGNGPSNKKIVYYLERGIYLTEIKFYLKYF
jgi:hypothetical protein